MNAEAPAVNSVPEISQTYLARQAIFDQHLSVVAYELLYRSGDVNLAQFNNGDQATGAVVLNALIEFGLEQVIGQQSAFVNVTRSFLLEGYCEALPRDRVVLEILENVEPTDDVLNAMQTLSEQGYRIALDDFVYHDRMEGMLRIADIVKVDVKSLDRDQLAQHVEQLQRFNVDLLAEKVETHDEFKLCRDLGFKYFQGYFVCRPQIISNRQVSPDRLGTLQLLSRLQDSALEIAELERLLSRDPALCVKLLRFINSSHCGLRNRVESIRHAATLVGLRRIRIWAGLLAFGDFSEKPSELIRTANVRARMCERIASYLLERDVDQCFTVGLFSLLDAFVDTPLESILGRLPLSAPINAALLRREGPAGRILDLVTAYERGEWNAVHLPGLPAEAVRNAYLEALSWTDTVLEQMRA